MRISTPKQQGARHLIFLILTVWFACAALACSGVSEEQRTRSLREYELAVSLYRDENKPREAILRLEHALRLDPENARAHLVLGTLYGLAEAYDRAATSLLRAMELFQKQLDDDLENPVLLAEAKNTYGAILVNLGRSEEAVRILSEVTSDLHYPSQHLALSNLGLAYLALHRDREAVEVLRRSVTNRPLFCVGHFRLGDALSRLGENQAALESLDKVINASTSQAPGCDRVQPAWLIRGQVHQRLQHQDQARADFVRCRDLAPETREGRECAELVRTLGAP